MPVRSPAASRFPLLACLAALAVIVAGSSEAAAENFAARARVDQAVQKCRAAGGKPVQAPGLTRQVRIGANAATVVDFAMLSCKGGPVIGCGPFGCQILVYLGAGSAPAFDGQAKAWRVRGPEFQVSRAAAYCSNSTSGACSETHRVSGGGLTLASRGALAFTRDPVAAPRAAAPRTARGKAGEEDAFEAPEIEPDPQPRVVPPSSESPEERRRKLLNAPYVR